MAQPSPRTGPAPHPAPARDEAAVSHFIERFATTLAEAGFPRMPARVFVGLLASESGRLSAAELADLLQVSPAAISGAVRYLTQINLASRGRDPGARRDHYWVNDDVWQEAMLQRDQYAARWEAALRDGVAALGPDTAAGQRLTETLAFFQFMQDEMAGMFKRWRARKAELTAAARAAAETASVE